MVSTLIERDKKLPEMGEKLRVALERIAQLERAKLVPNATTATESSVPIANSFSQQSSATHQASGTATEDIQQRREQVESATCLAPRKYTVVDSLVQQNPIMSGANEVHSTDTQAQTPVELNSTSPLLPEDPM